ncbi:E3 ubiquitin-protein ligase TRIM62-like [Rana temporaria]|uniref:E3 ubiquitin-protein ligase TRIM62-like n=1 Tax=Rana temporaria TaxID=8407 RepID=UPI001AAD67B8|nr:E3 ubiquitin-protein ligase TRIM62-like [Rana temporaria]
MASAALGGELSCSICLNLYTEPVSLKCGHNFCRDCISATLDTQEGSGVYSCPECRVEFAVRPVLEINRKLYNILEYFKSTLPKTEKADIFCTYCLDSPVLAYKTCLQCENSLCEKHLMAHNKSASHVVTEPTTSFADIKCPIHKEILKYYCTQDNVCICMSCWVAGEHVGHKMVLLNEAYENKKKNLKEDRVKLTHDKQEIEMRIQNLENHYIKEEKKSTEVSGRVSDLFRDMRRHLDDEEKRVLTEVSRQKEHTSLSVSNLIKKLKLQKEKLRMAVYDIEECLDITDQMTFLKTKLKNGDISISGDINSDVSDAGCLDEVTISLVLHRGLYLFKENSKHLKKTLKFLETENLDVLLNQNTANSVITISPDLRSVAYKDNYQKNLIGPEIIRGVQVLSSCSFSAGKHYWEVDVSGAEEWLVGVTAYNIEKKVVGHSTSFYMKKKSQGIDNKRNLGLHRWTETPQAIDFNVKSWAIGFNDKSWALQFFSDLIASHNDVHKTIVSDSLVQTVGIYLDYDEGRLSFYQMCDPIRLLHTFTTTFTEHLHAAFTLPKSGCVRIIT